jgi:Kef-type K+ transport system membrane component KefB
MLIFLGIGIKLLMDYLGVSDKDLRLNSILPILGNVGLVMIVLEAALDLKLDREKKGMIFRALLVAIVGIFGTSFGLAALFMYIFSDIDLYTALVYALPLSIMSSAIIIPSVGGLKGIKKEFMVYEGTFSDIIGIMVFYFLLGAQNSSDAASVFFGITLNILVTVILSVLIAYLMVYLFQHLKMQVKLFLIIAVLMFLYAGGKYFHLSSLLIILTFGLVLNNTEVFFRAKLAKYFDAKNVSQIMHDFHSITLESSFVVRTFFFVVFGINITLSSLYDFRVAINSIFIVLIFYAVRYISLRFIARKHVFPELFIAPRGLITVLLFFVVLETPGFSIPGFDPGLILYPILITSVIMSIALISYRGESVKDVLFNNIPLIRKGEQSVEELEDQRKRVEKNSE